MAEVFTKDYTRFVVCIDIPKADVNDAYAELRKFMDKGNKGRTDVVGWGTTEEGYSNINGFVKKIDPDVINQAIDDFIDKN